jgi:hypothetical protein
VRVHRLLLLLDKCEASLQVVLGGQEVEETSQSDHPGHLVVVGHPDPWCALDQHSLQEAPKRHALTGIEKLPVLTD